MLHVAYFCVLPKVYIYTTYVLFDCESMKREWMNHINTVLFVHSSVSRSGKFNYNVLKRNEHRPPSSIKLLFKYNFNFNFINI